MNTPTQSTWKLGTPSYALTSRLPGADFDQVVESVRAALAEQGFGVLTEIDLCATLKKKLDADVPRYLILGACMPTLAFAALQAEPGVGALLPCNVMVVQEPEAVAVSAIDPEALFGVVGRAEVAPIAADVKARLQRALDGVRG
jgi:uncharacterized protein (DUF302 family)